MVSHGLSISALLATLFDDFKVPEGGLKNASVTTIHYKNGEYTLDKVNDVSYLEAGKKNQNNLRRRETVYLGVGGARKGLLHQLLLLCSFY